MSTTTSTILLAEEHDATRAFLADNLTADGYRVLAAPDRAKALALLSTAHPNLILLDVNGQTLEFVDAIRSGEGLAGRIDPDTPLIVLSRDADRLQRIRVLERGGDYIVRKPFAYPELRARIAAVLRRSELRRQARVLRAGPIVIDVRSREVRVFDRPVELSPRSTTCWSRSPASRGGCSPVPSCCAGSGGFRRSGTRGRLTATLSPARF
jgi:DNA-binding response OmpR family regulator